MILGLVRKVRCQGAMLLCATDGCSDLTSGDPWYLEL